MATFNLSFNTQSTGETQNVTQGDVIYAVVSETAGGSIVVESSSNCSVSPLSHSDGKGTFTITNFSTPNYSVTFEDDDRGVTLSGTVTAAPSTDNGTISVADTTEGGSITISVIVIDYASSSWHYRILRVTGDGPDGIDPSYATVNPALGSQNITVSLENIPPGDSGSEVQYQGEQFTAELRTGPNPGVGNTSGTLLDSTSFKVFDDDTPVTSASSSTINYQATSHSTTLGFSFSDSGGSAVAYRIARVTSGGSVLDIRFSGTSPNPPGGNTTVTVNYAPAAGTTEYFRVDVYNGSTYIPGPVYTVTATAAPVAPVLSSVTSDNAAAPSVTATVNLSSTGANGTLQYIQKSGGVTPSRTDSEWTTSNTFTQDRNTTKYYWAQRNDGVTRAISNVKSLTVGYIAPDTIISVSPTLQTVPKGSTSHVITISSGDAGTTYEIRDATTTFQSITGNGALTVNDAPGNGDAKTYYVYAIRPTSLGGDGLYDDTGKSYIVVTQGTPVISTVTHDNAAAADVTATVNLSDASLGGDLQYIQKTVNSTPAIDDPGWQSGNTFSHPRTTARYYWAQRTTGTFREVSAVKSLSVGSIAPDTTITVDPTSQTLPAGSTSHTITISDGAADNVYRVRDSSTVHASRTGNGSLSVPDAPANGTSKTYFIDAQRPTNIGGSGVFNSTGTSYTVSTTPGEAGTIVPIIQATTEGSGQDISFRVTISNGTSSNYNWDTTRLTGSQETGGELGTGVEGTFASSELDGNNQYVINIPVKNNSLSEVNYGGETFSIGLYAGSVTPGSGTLLDTSSFVVYDDDTPVSAVSNVSVGLEDTSHTASITFSFFDSGGGAVSYRIMRGGTVEVASGTSPAPPGGTITPTVNDVPAAGSSNTYEVQVANGAGATYLAGPSYTVTKEASPVAPVISTVTDDNAAAASVTATINLSDTGSNGTLQYIQKSSNTTPAYNDTGWQAGNTFTQDRNTTRYYWAQRVNGTVRAISSVSAKTVGYIAPDVTIDVSPGSQTLPADTTSHSITISNGNGNNIYQVRDLTTSHESRTGNGVLTVTDAPGNGASKTYTLYAIRPTNVGGEGVYVNTNVSYNVFVSASSGGGGGGTGNNPTSENRLVLGKAIKETVTKYGLFISKNGTPVFENEETGKLTSEENLIFDSTTFKGGIIYESFTPTVNVTTGTWTTSSLGYIPGILPSGVFYEPYYFNGANADLAKEEYQALPVYEITETTIVKRTRYGGGSSWFGVLTPSDTISFLRFPCQYGKMGSSSLFGFTGTTPPAAPSTGYSRVLLGNHPLYGQGLFVSRPGLGKGVGAATRDELIFDSTQNNYSQILTTTSITLTRATLANPSEYDQTIAFDNAGEVPAVTVVPQDNLIGIDVAQIEIVSLSTSSVVLRLPYKANTGGTGSVINPASVTARVIVIKKG